MLEGGHMTPVFSEEQCTNIERWELNRYDELAGNLSSVVLIGTQGFARGMQKRLRQVGLVQVAFTDLNSSAWYSQIDDIEVLPPSAAAATYGDSAVFVVATFNPFIDARKIRNIFINLGCQCVISFLPIAWKFPEVFLPYFYLDLPSRLVRKANEIYKALDLFKDEQSISCFSRHLAWRMSGDLNQIPVPVDGPAYFREELFNLYEMETLVDCGAYTGDTIQQFLEVVGNAFKEIIGYEPDPFNYQQLARFISQLEPNIKHRIKVFNQAVTSCSGLARLQPGLGMGSFIKDDGKVEVKSCALDELLGVSEPTVIKLDIEGCERQALLGARGIIAKYEPVIAVAVYHQPNDLWELPLLIKELCPNYEFYLRPHGWNGFETVCYAIPPSRVRCMT